MVDKKIQSEVAIAALLHDIGKFKQRAYGGDESFIINEIKSMEGQLLPHTQDGRYTHRHALWTYDFFLNDFQRMIRESDNHFMWNIDLERIARFAAAHHSPSETFEKIITTADGYSAGLDRGDRQEYERGMNIRIPLRSLLAKIGCGIENQRSEWSYNLGKLSTCDTLMPRQNVILTQSDYRQLFDDFNKDLRNSLNYIDSYEQLIRKLKDLLLEYTWCIPSATNDFLCDISLYDHSITTMSIALALLCNPENDVNFRVCAFGISGIQSFIFQSKFASFKSAAKIFRGRSFLVSFFATAFEEYICDKLGLIPFFDVMEAGGNITLILPDIEGIEQKLQDYQTEIEIFLLKKYHATLSIIMDYSLLISVQKFGMGSYKNLRIDIGKRLNHQKSQKFKYAIRKTGYVFDEILKSQICSACGRNSTNTEEGFCELCEGQKSIGERLLNKNILQLSVLNGDYEILPGYFISFKDECDEVLPNSSVWSIDKEYDFYPTWRINNYTADETFEEIADNAVDWHNKGKRFLAYIKIDVDSLGHIINEGMTEREYSVSRFSTLSRTLHNFFNVHVYNLLEEEYPHSYTVLSGGDDLFLIMPWNDALSFVARLRNDFIQFVSQNKNLHFSAGVVLARDKEPFAFVNEKADAALDNQAKKFVGKNAISVLGITFSLDKLDSFISDCERFNSFVLSEDNPDGPLTMGFVYRLYQYSLDVLSDAQDLARKYGVYSKLHYDIARNVKIRNGNCEKCRDAIKFILDRFNNYRSVEDLEQLKLLLIQTMYNSRTTNMEER